MSANKTLIFVSFIFAGHLLQLGLLVSIYNAGVRLLELVESVQHLGDAKVGQLLNATPWSARYMNHRL